VLLLICATRIVQKRMLNEIPNTTINIAMLFNASKCQCYFESSCMQDYCPVATEKVAAINYQLIGMQQELKPNCCVVVILAGAVCNIYIFIWYIYMVS
jgi:hypothetical protein